MNIGLSSGAVGPEVVRLHRVLEAFGLVIEAGEKERREFGESTLEALVEFQRRRGLPAIGEIDEDTFAALVLVERDIDEGKPPEASAANPSGNRSDHAGGRGRGAGRRGTGVAVRAGGQGRAAGG